MIGINSLYLSGFPFYICLLGLRGCVYCDGTTDGTNATGRCQANETCETTEKEVSDKYSKLTSIPTCSQPVAHLGEITVDLEIHSMAWVESQLPWVKPGGRWWPRDCSPIQKLAIVVPYRDRELDLRLFVHNIHPFLAAQKLHYTIYLVEQMDGKHFNRGALLNVGFLESMRHERVDCVVFHDIDKFPEDSRNLYTCGDRPIHLVAKQRYKRAEYRKREYADYFGGVNAISSEQFRMVNGYASMFWGWGSEDDDFLLRMKHHGLKPSRVDDDIGRYAEIWHPFGFVNPRRHEVLKEGKQRYSTDGLSSMDYRVSGVVKKHLYTLIQVHLLHDDPYPMT